MHLKGLTDLLECLDLGLLRVLLHLLLLVVNALLDDGVDLFERGARIVREQDLLLARYPLLLLLTQILHLLLLLQALANLFVGPRLLGRLSLTLLRCGVY